MLIGCSQCKQIIEIATLTEHLLSECDLRSKFRQCPRCKDAIIDKEFDAHVAAKACAPPGPGKLRCPLCRSQIPNDPEAWMVHLIDEGCPANPRTAT
jgi:centrosomal protein CEP104